MHIVKDQILIHSIVEFVMQNRNKGFVDGNSISPYDSVSLFCMFDLEIPSICAILHKSRQPVSCCTVSFGVTISVFATSKRY